jgi:glutathione gamma-glutamylcysteinyltransferase
MSLLPQDGPTDASTNAHSLRCSSNRCASPAVQCCTVGAAAAPQPPRPPAKSLYTKPLPPGLVHFCSPAGRTRLARALTGGTAAAFCPLVAQLQTQAFPAACGVTTLAVVLNAARVDPCRVWHTPWRWYDERFLYCCSPEERVRAAGVTLDEFACIAQCHGLLAEVMRGLADVDARALVERVVSAEGGEDGEISFLVAAFSRAALGQTGDGHFSPVAAYDAETDSVLVLDTARFKYPPFWVRLPELNSATRAVDAETQLPRGFVVLTRPADDGADALPPIINWSESLQRLDAALGAERGASWSAAQLVDLVLEAVGADMVDCCLSRRFSLLRARSTSEDAFGAALAETPVGRYVLSMTGGDVEFQQLALFVLGCLATSEKRGLSSEEVSLPALGIPWTATPAVLQSAILHLASALLTAVDGIQATSSD